MTQSFFSIIIPVFNRAWCVERAIDSAVAFARDFLPAEIVLVDDASTDNSSQIIREVCERYRHESGFSFQHIVHPTNRGVCAAKNSGAKAATGQWLVFFDSDDELITGTATAVRQAILDNPACPLHFFKCVSENAMVSNRANVAELRDFSEYLKRGTDGEALPIIDRTVFLDYLYDEDVRGFESLAYLRLVRKFSSVLNSLEVRRYYTSHDDRLSSKRGMASRYRDLALGNSRVLKEHRSLMKFDMIAKQYLRLLKYRILSRISR